MHVTCVRIPAWFGRGCRTGPRMCSVPVHGALLPLLVRCGQASFPFGKAGCLTTSFEPCWETGKGWLMSRSPPCLVELRFTELGAASAHEAACLAYSYGVMLREWHRESGLWGSIPGLAASALHGVV